jgi:hypothetical protein
MDRKIQILTGAGLIITFIAFLFSIYAAGIVFIILVVLVMSLLIMQDSTHLPDVVAELRADAKGIILYNTGNAPALDVHVALVPENIEFDLPSLAVEESHTHPVEKMIEEIKVVVTFKNEKGNAFSRIYRLSAIGEPFDPLKPMIPVFHYKK